MLTISFEHKSWQLLICVILASSVSLILRLPPLYLTPGSVPDALPPCLSRVR
jgi:hypothetical protein